MAYEEMELDRIGDRRTATFFIISDTSSTHNFVVALAFSQMFNLLCERADKVHGGRLPHHVRVLWDEAANTGQVPQLEKIVAVIHSREISLCLFYQQMVQCKAIYKDNAETILGNMDSKIFLGGRESSTIKELSEVLGKETISMQTEGRPLKGRFLCMVTMAGSVSRHLQGRRFLWAPAKSEILREEEQQRNERLFALARKRAICSLRRQGRGPVSGGMETTWLSLLPLLIL